MRGDSGGCVTLKHVAREFDVAPDKLRRILRSELGLVDGRRWRWDEGSESLMEVRRIVARRLRG